MTKRRLLISAVVVAILGVLIYLQVRTWKRFNWEAFATWTENVNWWVILPAIGAIYLADALRALRWAIFLRPIQKVQARRLIASQFIGFAGLALLGRPGEFIRPYIIARKTRLTFSSQVAVWTVERIFDTSAVALLLATQIIFSSSMHDMEDYSAIRKGGILLILLVLVGIAIAFFIRRNSKTFAAWVGRRFRPHVPNLSRKLEHKILAFGEGLNTIHDLPSFLGISLISLSIWMLVVGAYFLVTHAYGASELQDLSFSHATLLMAVSVAGGVLQLPLIGGGSQLATISVLLHVFEISPDTPELATSCGILLWLVTFMSVAPVGLALARHEHLSLRKLSKEPEELQQKMGSEAIEPVVE